MKRIFDGIWAFLLLIMVALVFVAWSLRLPISVIAAAWIIAQAIQAI